MAIVGTITSTSSISVIIVGTGTIASWISVIARAVHLIRRSVSGCGRSGSSWLGSGGCSGTLLVFTSVTMLLATATTVATMTAVRLAATAVSVSSVLLAVLGAHKLGS